jgi:hypothetical protein
MYVEIITKDYFNLNVVCQAYFGEFKLLFDVLLYCIIKPNLSEVQQNITNSEFVIIRTTFCFAQQILPNAEGNETKCTRSEC